MPGITQALSIIITLVQLAGEASAAASELMTLINKARAEGRDLTDAELDSIRVSVIAARDRLTGNAIP